MNISDRIASNKNFTSTTVKSASMQNISICNLQIHLIVYALQSTFYFEVVFQFYCDFNKLIIAG